MPKFHKSLTPEKWRQLTFGRQLMMIATELFRARKWIEQGRRDEILGCYERALELVDLTVSVQTRRNAVRELLRFRELLAGGFLLPPDLPELNQTLYSVILTLSPESFQLRVSGPA